MDPTLTAARNNLALVYAAAGRLDLAQEQFLNAGDRATGLYNTGIAYLAAGDRANALAVFDEASRTRVPFALARERASQLRALLRSHPTSIAERPGASGPKLP
jgi:tetratricopeptide (TPR) repeat protein